MKSKIHTIDPSSPRPRAWSKCDLSFCRSLKSFQPANRASFHMSARTHVHGKMFRCRPREFPAWHGTARRGGEKKKKGVREGEKDAKNGARCSVPPIENHALRGVFFLHTIGIRAARSLSLPAFQRFPVRFFSMQAC